MNIMFPYKISLGSIIALVIGGFTLTYYKYQPWNYVFWGIAGILIVISLIFYFRVSNNSKRNMNNWIIAYKSRTKILPVIPEYLLPIVQKYTKGSSITRDIEIIPMSGQFWNNLHSSQKEELKQLVEWLGMNWLDYLEKMKRSLPQGINPGQAKTNPRLGQK